MDSISIEVLQNISALSPLAADAESDGRRMVSRLIQEWTDGINRFDRPGERLYAAVESAQLIGVCGLNVDPFAGDQTVGRVRRLYVAVAHRRRSVGSAIMNRLLADATKHFSALHVRTYDPGACEFYESIGFSKVDHDVNCTHRLKWVR